jgi:hypothetical protein
MIYKSIIVYSEYILTISLQTQGKNSGSLSLKIENGSQW